MTIDLTGLWRFQPDPAAVGEAYGYPEPDYDHHRWREVWVPVDFETCHPALETYEGAGWFRRWVSVPAEWRDRRVAVDFAGVNTHASVWVNGHMVGCCEDPFLPFSFDVQRHLSCGDDNLIVVRIDNERRPGEVPGLQRGWRNYGGFLRDAVLRQTPLCHIADVQSVAVPAEDGGHLDLQVSVRNSGATGARATVTAEVVTSEGVLVSRAADGPHLLPVGQTVPLGLALGVAGVQPWSPDHPRLYTVRVTLALDGHPVDTEVLRVGFRTIEACKGQLWLNGSQLFLTGYNRHEDSWETNMCPDLADTRRDLLAMKEAGANFVRLCHYPHHPGELDLCDEIGLLVMDEIPLYWWSGTAEVEDPIAGREVAVQKLAAAKRQLETLIRRDRNHPSVIFWSVSNETHEDRPEVAAGNGTLVHLAQALDPTRLAVHVSNHWQDQSTVFEADDVVCVNAYPSVRLAQQTNSADVDLAPSTAFWRTELARLHGSYPDKPILVTEFGYTSFLDVVDNAFSGELHAAVLEAEFAGMDAPYICGATVWCWADHAWPPATFKFCGRLAVSPYGVLTRDRRRKPAYWTARRAFRTRQGALQTTTSVAPSEPGPDGREIHMVRPHLKDIPQVALPAGLSIRTLRPDEGGLWTDIWRDADRHLPIDAMLFYREFGDDLQALRWRSFVVQDEQGAGVGTITAWYDRNYKGEDYGQIHWVAVRRAYWGRGLGKAMMTHALNQMAQWHTRAFLGTQTKRLAAIKIYLDFGFVPDLDREGSRNAWREVKRALPHPVLQALVL